jgi:hypothetical protein
LLVERVHVEVDAEIAGQEFGGLLLAQFAVESRLLLREGIGDNNGDS